MVKFLAGILVGQFILGGLLFWQVETDFALFGGDVDEPEQAAAAAPKPDRFDAARAFRLVREQVAIGERPAGSAASRRLARRLATLLPSGRLEPVKGHRGLQNVVGRLPGARPAILVGAHYDTKDIPGFVGAEDAAGGTAAVVGVARALRASHDRRRHREIRFVLFDGEEDPREGGDFYAGGLRGSKAYAAAHHRELREVIVLDFVAQKDLSTPREQGSDPALWSRLRAAARRVGRISAYPATERGEIQDDHTPFARRGLPAIDLIDFEYPYWHTTQDTLDKLSARSLDASGETVVELVRTLR